MKECPYCRKVACVCEKPAHVPDRLAALEQRVGALEARAEDSDAEPCDDPELRALNAQIDRDCNVESTESHMLLDENGIAPAPVGTRNCKRLQRRIEFMIATLATARRERDEAVGVVRDLDSWASTTTPPMHEIVARARALVAGQPVVDPRDAEIERLRCSAKGWKADAERYAQNADYAHDRATALRAHAEKLDGLCERVLESTPHLLECRSAGAGICDACRRRIKLDSGAIRARGEVPR